MGPLFIHNCSEDGHRRFRLNHRTNFHSWRVKINVPKNAGLYIHCSFIFVEQRKKGYKKYSLLNQMHNRPSVISLWDSEMENQFLSVSVKTVRVFSPFYMFSFTYFWYHIASLIYLFYFFYLYATIKSGRECKYPLICVELACTNNRLAEDEIRAMFSFQKMVVGMVVGWPSDWGASVCVHHCCLSGQHPGPRLADVAPLLHQLL